MDSTTITVAAMQRIRVRGDFVEARNIYTNETGRVLQDESHLPLGITAGSPNMFWRTVAIRWPGRGIFIYRVVEVTSSGGHPIWTLRQLHGGL